MEAEAPLQSCFGGLVQPSGSSGAVLTWLSKDRLFHGWRRRWAWVSNRPWRAMRFFMYPDKGATRSVLGPFRGAGDALRPRRRESQPVGL
jgi:hypothetical protein